MDACWIRQNTTGFNKLKEVFQQVEIQLFEYYYIACTDGPIECGKVSDTAMDRILSFEGSLLELRLFASEREIRFWRNNIMEDWSCRLADDDYFKQNLEQRGDPFIHNLCVRRIKTEQFLDIDLPKTKKLADKCHPNLQKIGLQAVQSTGGGIYYLPEMELTEKSGIRLFYYLDFEESGQSMVADWRMAGFCPVKEVVS